MKKFPSLAQWKQIFRVLKKKEKITFFTFFVLAIISLGFLVGGFYYDHTKVVPAFGGTFVEGVVGQPRFINPVYGETNDIDRTLIDLVFSGLVTYDNQGNIVKDLASDYKISSDGKIYTFTLKDNLYWHDGQPLTADDVIFTVKTIQNSDYKSPLRANWIDVQATKISDRSLTFTLRQSYNSFLENCTLKIIPKHIWQNISPENFALSPYNLQPVGSGPFAFFDLSQTSTGFIETLRLQSNRKYYNAPSFLSGISFRFFGKIDDIILAAGSKTINGFAAAALDAGASDIAKQINQSWTANEKFTGYSFSLPRYFAVFFNNQKTSLFSDTKIRQALTLAVNKSELVQNMAAKTNVSAKTVDSPILPDFYGYQSQTSTAAYQFDTQKANTLLDKAGFTVNASGQREKAITKKPAFQFKSYLKIGSKGSEVTQLQACLARLNDSLKNILASETDGKYGAGTENAVTLFQKQYLPDQKPTGETGPSTRNTLNEVCVPKTSNSQPLAFTLVTVNQAQLLEVANTLKKYWQDLGVQVQINAVSVSDIKPIIKNRSYDALLYGETLGMEPDLYPFWYSAQKQDPGLNLSLYENKDVDKLLQDARQTMDPDQKKQDLEKIQNQIIADAPALFLYNPDYMYWVSTRVQGMNTTKIADPAKRLVNITQWFMQTKRIWK